MLQRSLIAVLLAGLILSAAVAAPAPSQSLLRVPADGADDIIVLAPRWTLPSLQDVQDYNKAELERLGRRYATSVRKPRPYEADLSPILVAEHRTLVRMIAESPRLSDTLPLMLSR
jgi:hypothetical protein